MDDIRSRYDEIFAQCAVSPNSFEHVPDPRGFWTVTPEERRALWDELYAKPGFALLAANFPEIFLDEAANREVSAYVAERIRKRVKDPEMAEKLIPAKDHGFGMQRLPLETRYFEAYNRDDVHLVDLQETPIERITTGRHSDVGGPPRSRRDRLRHRLRRRLPGASTGWRFAARGARRCATTWREGASTYYGLLSPRVPQLPDGGRPAERVGFHELSPRDRARRRLGDGPDRTRTRSIRATPGSKRRPCPSVNG